jgi:hypothetical protein
MREKILNVLSEYVTIAGWGMLIIFGLFLIVYLNRIWSLKIKTTEKITEIRNSVGWKCFKYQSVFLIIVFVFLIISTIYDLIFK